MIVDENLNDCSNKYIKSLQKKLKLVTWKFRWMSVFTILLLLASSIFHTKLKNVAEDNKILKEQLYKDETELALEHSIGYWFINKPEEINDSILYVFLRDNNAWYPEILLKQAKLESGNYSSNVYKNTNNLYGMKKVGKRLSTQLKDTYNGYGCYTNWCESVLDRLLWDIFYFKNEKPTKEEYLKAMSIYAEAENYVELLN
jgi:hypothetical protein